MSKKELKQLLDCVEYALEQYESSCIEVIEDAEDADTYKRLIWNLKLELNK